jgi:hypothetical protein
MAQGRRTPLPPLGWDAANPRPAPAWRKVKEKRENVEPAFAPRKPPAALRYLQALTIEERDAKARLRRADRRRAKRKAGE